MVDVVVGVIVDTEGRVLITQRSLSKPHGGLWEFPGGKVEPGETCSLALFREIKEEVGLSITKHRFLGIIEDKECGLFLHVYWVTEYKGEAVCLEKQMALRWVVIDSLSTFSFPKANSDILVLIRNQEVGCSIHINGTSCGKGCRGFSNSKKLVLGHLWDSRP